MAYPEQIPAMAGFDTEPEEAHQPGHDGQAWQENDAPHIQSPSISADWPDSQNAEVAEDKDDHRHWDSVQKGGGVKAGLKSRLRSLGRPIVPFKLPLKWQAALPPINLTTISVAMGALVFGMLIWRADVVRAMPQTAAFFKGIGMPVNLRNLAIQDVKITTETVNNKPVLLIEGAIVDIARKPLEIPRLRFIVRDAHGADLYAWNAVLEQPVLNPGDKAWFKTRLATPPAEGREIAVRFFHKQDIAAGGT